MFIIEAHIANNNSNNKFELKDDKVVLSTLFVLLHRWDIAGLGLSGTWKTKKLVHLCPLKELY